MYGFPKQRHRNISLQTYISYISLYGFLCLGSSLDQCWLIVLCSHCKTDQKAPTLNPHTSFTVQLFQYRYHFPPKPARESSFEVFLSLVFFCYMETAEGSGLQIFYVLYLFQLYRADCFVHHYNYISLFQYKQLQCNKISYCYMELRTG